MNKPRVLRWLWIGIALVGGGIVLWGLLSNKPVPPSPNIRTEGLEPAVATLIEKTKNELQKSPRSGPSWGVLGMVLQNYEFTAEAIQCFQVAERFDSQDPRWPYWLGLLIAQEDPGAALPKLMRAAQLSGNKYDAPRLKLALLMEDLGQIEPAARHFDQLRRSHANHMPALLGLARIHIERGQFEEAADKLRLCLGSPYTTLAAQVLLSSVERRIGHEQVAASLARQAATQSLDASWPDPFWIEAEAYHVGQKAWSDRAQGLLDQGRAEEALSWIDRLLEAYPQEADHWLLLARARLQLKHCAEAEQALRKHLQLSPKSVNGYSELGSALLCQERYADAVTSLITAIELKPDHGWAHFNLGIALARSGRGLEAIPAFRQAIRYNPGLIDPYITLADLLNQAGEKEEALSVLQAAANIHSDDQRVRILMERIQQ